VNHRELTGQARTHISDVLKPRTALHSQVLAPFLQMRRAAHADGIDLIPMSGFRDFSRQLAIWNGKFSGERAMHGAAGELLDGNAMSEHERIDAILFWSALPGASRHHWGTDIDLVDALATAPGYQVKLTREEFGPGGPFLPMAEWLEINAARFGFFRPFKGERSGVQPEPWHYSFAPIAENARRDLTAAVLYTVLNAAPLLGKESVLGRLEELHGRYVACIDLPG
jgi:LAS superfamily LD-carboxypeptidase LdcB